MRPHRPHSPKTVIILILVSVLSFAFVACESAGQKCDSSNNKDKGGSIENYPECNEKLASAFILYSGLKGQTPLSETVKKLNKRYDVNCKFIRDKNYTTPLKYTIIQFQSLPEAESIVNALINAGADVNEKYDNGNTPLHMPNMNNHKITKALIDAGADVNAKNSRGVTPIMGPLNFDGVKTLIDAGADVNAKDKDGETPLCYQTNVKVVKALIDAGADVNAKDKDGKTPLMKTILLFNVDVVKTLIDAGADVNAKDKDGKTPLMEAILLSNVDVVKTLIDAGADVNAKDKDGKTALEMAESLKLTKMADFLRSSTKPNTANESWPIQFHGNVPAVHINHRERHQIMPVYNAEECKFYKNAKLTSDAKTAPKNLSRFFKSFNPSFYEYAIQRFIENPITVTRTAKTCTMPLDGECYYYEQFFLDSNCSVSVSEKNAFITVSDAQKYQLNKGDVFPTCLLDSKKSNKSNKSGTECRGKFKNNSYWQVLEDTPRTIYQWSQGTDSEECNEVRDKVIFVYDQEGIETRRALYNEIELGMQNLNQLCQ